jgi:hypothetical protein
VLPSRLNSTTRTYIFGKFWITHKSVSSSCINSKGQTPRFHTLEFVQGLETYLNEHRRITTMFQ